MRSLKRYPTKTKSVTAYTHKAKSLRGLKFAEKTITTPSFHANSTNLLFTSSKWRATRIIDQGVSSLSRVWWWFLFLAHPRYTLLIPGNHQASKLKRKSIWRQLFLVEKGCFKENTIQYVDCPQMKVQYEVCDVWNQHLYFMLANYWWRYFIPV